MQDRDDAVGSGMAYREFFHMEVLDVDEAREDGRAESLAILLGSEAQDGQELVEGNLSALVVLLRPFLEVPHKIVTIDLWPTDWRLSRKQVRKAFFVDIMDLKISTRTIVSHFRQARCRSK